MNSIEESHDKIQKHLDKSIESLKAIEKIFNELFKGWKPCRHKRL